MNEEAIRERLAQVKSSVVEHDPGMMETPAPQEETPLEAFHNNLPLDNMVLRSNAMDFLDVPVGQRGSAETMSQVDEILRWASENSASKEMSDILETLLRQTRMMGISLRDDKLSRLYRYVRLANQRHLIETQMKATYV